MQIRESVVDSMLVIRLNGDLDSRSAPVAQEQILPSLPADERILLDLTGVPFVSSAGLRTMLLIYRQAQIMNSSVALVGLSQELRDVLTATGFLEFFVVADTLTEAVGLLRDSELPNAEPPRAGVVSTAEVGRGGKLPNTVPLKRSGAA
jgi:anti-sigma B factor antagonist